ncbi:unnamed protein product [Citrullus colocynthis]|uniref:Uncharacterized protein n=1 Tax=Citrullus colocynthis TaxID=252529 RepID=A0ABP0YC70_9ROSI
MWLPSTLRLVSCGLFWFFIVLKSDLHESEFEFGIIFPPILGRFTFGDFVMNLEEFLHYLFGFPFYLAFLSIIISFAETCSVATPIYDSPEVFSYLSDSTVLWVLDGTWMR